MMTVNKSRLGLTLALIIIFCFATPASPASAHPGKMKWSVIDTPSSMGNIVVSPSEINAIAIGCDSRTFYAIDIPNGKLYKSVNGGISWDDFSGNLTSDNATLPVWNIAVAPDNPDFVAVVTSYAGFPREVFISTNGGASWQDTSCPVTSNIGAIDISANYGNHDIAIGTRTGAGNGDVYVSKTTGLSNWASQSFTGDILAIKFSPSYAADSSLVTVSADATGTYANLGIRDAAANTTGWGAWGPVEITTAGSGTSPTIAQILTADLELPSDFSGQSPSLRRCYISTDAPTSTAGIYRLDNTVGYHLMSATTDKRISSIAYYGAYGSGKLLAGEVLGNPNSATVMTWFTDAPITCPEPCWYQTLKAPSGAAGTSSCTGSSYGNAQIAWSPDGSSAYVGTASTAALVAGAAWPNPYLTGENLDESAFSWSHNNGETWNQTSLVDTEISFLSDVVASPDSETLYLASINSNNGCSSFDSVWRSTGYPPGGIWERVLCILTDTDDTILRTSQDKTDQSVFLGIRATSDLYQSQDGGQTWHDTLPNVDITDFAVTKTDDTMQMYVLEGNCVRKGESTSHAWKWGKTVDTGLDSGHTITATPAGVVVIGDAGQGMVSCSGDGGAHFTRTPAVPVLGKMHAIVDARIGNYIVIYAASDGAGGKIYCWVVGASTGWTDMEPPGEGFYGLAQAGILYAAWSTGTDIGVDRTLNPEDIGPPFIEWDTLDTGLDAGVVFTREPVSLKASDNIDLWAIDNRSYDWQNEQGCLWGFCDCMTAGPHLISSASLDLLFRPPAPVSPAMNEVIPVDLDTTRVADINFKWQHPTQATRYELWLAKDKEFDETIMQKTVIPDSPLAPAWTLLSQTSAIVAGETYYWKLRVTRAANGETGEGQWSKLMSFSVASGSEQETPYPALTLLTPENDATNTGRFPSFSWTPLPGATEYELTLATDEALEQVVANLEVSGTTYDYDTDLEWGATYFWQVKATAPSLSQPSPVFSFTVAVEGEPYPSSWIPGLPLWLWIMIALLAAASVAAFVISKTKPGIFKNLFGKVRGNTT